MNYQIEDYGNIPQALHVVFSKYSYTEQQKLGVIMIWDFLERVSTIMAKDYQGDIRHMEVNHIKLCTFGTKETRDGKVKTIKAIQDLPYRTLHFFENRFTDIREANGFFNPFNRTNGIEWLIKHVLIEIQYFKLSDFVLPGVLAHLDAINKYNYHQDETNKKVY